MVALSGKTRDPIPLEDRIPREIVEHIVSFLSHDVRTIAKWEKISKQFYSVAEQHWVTLWNKEHPTTQLKKNHRLGCMQLFAYLQQHKPKPNYNNEVKIVVAGEGGVRKKGLKICFV